MRGDIVLIPFPNSDLTPGKLRPALVLYDDAIENETAIAYISSKVPIISSPCDVLITRGNQSFVESGLKLNSVLYFPSFSFIYILNLLLSLISSFQGS
jgi:mRNA interferase MazF